MSALPRLLLYRWCLLVRLQLWRCYACCSTGCGAGLAVLAGLLLPLALRLSGALHAVAALPGTRRGRQRRAGPSCQAPGCWSMSAVRSW